MRQHIDRGSKSEARGSDSILLAGFVLAYLAVAALTILTF